jgi:hypothetical protein
MTKSIKILALLAVVFTLISCAKSQDKEQDVQKLEIASFDKAPEYSKTYPSAQELVSAYKQANDPFCWFVQTKLPPLDINDAYIIEDIPIAYYRVVSDQVVNLETLEKYLSCFYDAETVSLLMDVNVDIQKFVEDEKGNLYCHNFTYTPEGFGEKEEYKVEKNSDTKYTLTVLYDRLDGDGKVKGQSDERYVYEKIDDRWVFTRYRVFRQ